MMIDTININSRDRSNPSLAILPLTARDKDIWDKLNQTAPEGCFMQSWAWANFKELEGYQTFRYGVWAGSKLVGGAIIYFYPHSSSANLLIAPGAPIFLPGYLQAGLPLLLQQAEILAQNLGAIALRIEPLWLAKPTCLKDFSRAPADLLPSETLLIDLRQTEAEMLKNFKQKGRYNLRRSWKQGVKTEFTRDSQAIPIFYDLFWETVQRQQFFGEPYSFFINLCQTLFPENLAEIGLAKWQGENIAAMLVVYCGDRATYLYGGRSGWHSQLMAPYALHWAAMQRAKQRGCTVYDFYGFNREPQHSYAKFSQFKSQFGGAAIATIGAQDYFFYDQLADTIINLLQKLEGV